MTASLHHSLPELARAAGISESTARRYVKTFAPFLRFEDKGRIRLYRPECVQVLKRIRELYDQGHDTDQVHDVLSQEYDRIIEQDPGAGGGPPQTYQGPDAGGIAQELVSAIKRNDRTEQEVQKVKKAVRILRDHVVQLRGEQKALPDPQSMDQMLARLDQMEDAIRRLEGRVQALESERSRRWWARIRGK